MHQQLFCKIHLTEKLKNLTSKDSSSSLAKCPVRLGEERVLVSELDTWLAKMKIPM